MQKIQEEEKDYEYWLGMVKSDCRVLAKVPDKYITKEICLEALNQIDDCTFQYIPHENITIEMCLEFFLIDTKQKNSVLSLENKNSVLRLENKNIETI